MMVICNCLFLFPKLIYAIRQLKDAQASISGHFGSIRLPAAASALCWDAVATTWNDPAMRILSIWITFLAFGVVASGSAGPLVVMTEADSGHRIALRIGQELFLNLKSNPSTGYSWIRADTETSVLVMLGKPAYKPGSPLPGASGMESWKFRAVERGAQTLKLEYRRPWEKNTPPANTIVLYVTVR